VGASGRGDRRGDDAPGGASAGVTTGDRVAAAVEELYGAAPEAFTGRRGDLVAAARTAGDRAAAKAIAALRKPTRAAWVVNRLARADPGAPPKLAELAAALRAAQQAGQGPRLRELSAARGALVDALAAQALAVAGVPDPPASLRLEVTETLTAALADPEVAAAFTTGTLTRAVQWSGFGVLPADTEPDEETGEAPRASERTEAATRNASGAGDAGPGITAVPDAAGPGSSRGRSGQSSARPSVDAHGSRRSGDTLAREEATAGSTARRERAGAGLTKPAAVARRQAEENERLVRETAERSALRREQHAEAERVVDDASAAAAEAVSEEDRLEAEVLGLERRLTQARADLAAARMRARHAEAAERRARQVLNRLPRP
jgi:hypothetical protein